MDNKEIDTLNLLEIQAQIFLNKCSEIKEKLNLKFQDKENKKETHFPVSEAQENAIRI